MWFDGQDCNGNLTTDERCYLNCAFDETGPYGNLNNGSIHIENIDDSLSDGSVFCEVKCKGFLMIQSHNEFNFR
jgi:hypothetical protein